MSSGPAEVGGVLLADHAALDALTRELAAQWRLPDQRVAGTLWWYMACDVLLSGPVRAIVAGTAIPDPTLEATIVTLRPDAGLAQVRYLRDCATPADAHRALRDTVDRVLGPLAEVSGASPAALRALVTDALSTIALALAPDRAEVEAQAIAVGVADLPMPRFVEVAGNLFVHRVSCCMVDRIPGAEMCVSCPRRDGDERADLLARRARA
jgi:hypothetical protein